MVHIAVVFVGESVYGEICIVGVSGGDLPLFGLGLEADSQVGEMLGSFVVHVGNNESESCTAFDAGTLRVDVLGLQLAGIDEEPVLVLDVSLSIESEFHLAFGWPF